MDRPGLEYEQARGLERKRERAETKTPNVLAPIRENLESRRDFIRVLLEHRTELGEDRIQALCRRHLGAMTQIEIGMILGVSKQRVEQIEMKALAKARKELEGRGLRWGDL